MENKLTLNAHLKWPDVPDDYVVKYEGHVIGRIWREDQIRRSVGSWNWMIVVPMGLPDWTRGASDARDDGMKALAAAWQRLLGNISPERLERAWELERAAEARVSKPSNGHA